MLSCVAQLGAEIAQIERSVVRANVAGMEEIVLGMSPARRALSMSGATPSTDAAELMVAGAAHNGDPNRQSRWN